MKNWQNWLEAALIFCVFALFGAYAAPDVNEAHYLGKAAAFWNPNYAPGDFFLESPDAHAVFYWSFGWLTLFLPMEAVAWIGRILTWALLAVGWLYMLKPLAKRFGDALISATLFLFLYSHFSFAGEWVVGGVEAKGFAFVFLFFALGSLIREHWNRAWILLGFSAMFHVLIGGWSIVAVGISWLILRDYEGKGSRIPTLWSMLPAIGVAFLLTLPALIPALLLNSGVDADTTRVTNHLYVFERLPHHLLLSSIAHKTPKMLINFGALFLIWSMLATRPRYSNGDMNLRTFVYGTAFIAATGWVINLFLNIAPDTVASLLRFYWFRMVDVCVPMGVAILAVEWCRNPQEVAVPDETELKQIKDKKERKQKRRQSEMLAKRLRHRQSFLLCVLIGLCCFQLYESGSRVLKWAPPRSCSGAKFLDDWKDVCRYIRENTEPTDRFIVPYTTRTFTWYARRPVVGVWKDVPQDSKNLLEWWNRMQTQFYGIDTTSPQRSYGRLKSLGLMPPERIEALGRKYHAPYVLSTKGDIHGRELVYENAHFGVWRTDRPAETAPVPASDAPVTETAPQAPQTTPADSEKSNEPTAPAVPAAEQEAPASPAPTAEQETPVSPEPAATQEAPVPPTSTTTQEAPAQPAAPESSN